MGLFYSIPITLLFAAAPYTELLRLYDYDRNAPLEIQETGVQVREGVSIHDISYASPRGGRVPGYVIVPAGPGPFAGIIFMHGAGGSRAGVLSQAIMYAKTGAVSLAIDAPM